MQILIIEDNITYRKYLHRVIGSEQVSRIDLSHNLATAIKLSQRYDYDIVLIDLGLPDSSGADTVRKFRSFFDRPKLVVVTNLLDESIVEDALTLGADAYLMKDAAESQILKVLDLVQDGFTILPPHSSYQAKFGKAVSTQIADDNCSPLSVRQLEVLRLLSHGITYKKIAEILEISLSTVQTHIKNIYQKIGCNNKIDAINWFHETSSKK